MNAICLLCLNNTKQLLNIFSNIPNNGPISAVLEECVAVKISPKENMPKQLCNKCWKKVMQFSAFRKMCHKSEFALRQFDASKDKSLHLYLETLRINFRKFTEKASFENTNKFAESDAESSDHLLENDPLELDLSEIKSARNTEKDRLETNSSLKKQQLCHICGKMCLQISVHNLSHGERSFQCNVCTKTFTSPNGLRHHKTIHDKSRRYACDQCGTSCTTAATLRRHVRIIHQNLRPHICTICKKAFSSRFNLKTHHRSHTKAKYEKPKRNRVKQDGAKGMLKKVNARKTACEYTVCKICDEELSSQREYRKHMVVVHGFDAKREGIFDCDICKEKFHRLKNFQKHLESKHVPKVDVKEDPIQCEVCLKVFKRKKNLYYHAKLHTEIGRTQKCEICKKTFTYRFFLNEHMRIHTGERPAKCDLCDKAFISFRQLRKHKIIHLRS